MFLFYHFFFATIFTLSLCQIGTIYKRRRLQTMLDSLECAQAQENTNITLSSGIMSTPQSVVEYFINISIGTPPQNFTFQFDTGSNILWVPTTKSRKNGFNISQSSTYVDLHQSQNYSYAGGNWAYGILGKDVVNILPLIQVKQKILFVTKESKYQDQFDCGVVGIVGMGFTSTPNFLDAAYEAGQIQTNVFTLNLLPIDNNSIIYYNEIPEEILNSTLYSPVTNLSGSGVWDVNLIGVYAGTEDLTQYASNNSVIDSGTSSFNLNPSLYNVIVEQYLSGCNTTNSGYFQCVCANISMPTLIFMFEGVQVQLNQSSYVVEVDGGENCQVYINTLSTQTNQIVLGDTLFLKYMITFDKSNARIGFLGDDVQKIQVIGKKNDSLTISQYVMVGIEILLLILMIIVFCAMIVCKGNNEEIQPLLNPSNESLPNQKQNSKKDQQ